MTGPLDVHRSKPNTGGGAVRYQHAGAVFGTEAEYRSLLYFFITAGVQLGERICCLVPGGERLRALDRLAAAGLNVGRLTGRGQLLVMSVRDHHVRLPLGEPGGMLAWLARYADNTRAEGFSGLRIMVEANWIRENLRPPDADGFEAYIDRLTGDRPGAFLCAYDRRRCGTEAHLWAAAHRDRIDPALSYRDESLQIVPVGSGIRVIGRVDMRNRAVFTRVLTAAVDRALSTRTDVQLHVHHLSDPDGPAVAALARTARQLSAIGLSLVLRAPSTSLLRIASVLWDELPAGLMILP
ncbi:MEDS domain-containing protein [Amycolatopsis solani]|uniref:MEDS domain-containing protein n=1 Tax=Amycolatopsis solani TaxID=3028615 RepID=UPI0025AF7DC7|nr:MEDS domain-containing protein [Amycolatopsis sp. MEP2-6]